MVPTPEQAPAEISRVQALYAARDGGAACREGSPLTSCPWDGVSVESRFLRAFWLKGWRAASIEHEADG